MEGLGDIAATAPDHPSKADAQADDRCHDRWEEEEVAKTNDSDGEVTDEEQSHEGPRTCEVAAGKAGRLPKKRCQGKEIDADTHAETEVEVPIRTVGTHFGHWSRLHSADDRGDGRFTPKCPRRAKRVPCKEEKGDGCADAEEDECLHGDLCCLAFDMSGEPKGATPPLRHPIGGGVSSPATARQRSRFEVHDYHLA